MDLVNTGFFIFFITSIYKTVNQDFVINKEWSKKKQAVSFILFIISIVVEMTLKSTIVIFAALIYRVVIVILNGGSFI